MVGVGLAGAYIVDPGCFAGVVKAGPALGCDERYLGCGFEGGPLSQAADLGLIQP